MKMILLPFLRLVVRRVMKTRKCYLCGRKDERFFGFEETQDGRWKCSDKSACVERRSVCWLCGGSGRDPHFKLNICPECRGCGKSWL